MEGWFSANDEGSGCNGCSDAAANRHRPHTSNPTARMSSSALLFCTTPGRMR
jgi:hypothetical protein